MFPQTVPILSLQRHVAILYFFALSITKAFSFFKTVLKNTALKFEVLYKKLSPLLYDYFCFSEILIRQTNFKWNIATVREARAFKSRVVSTDWQSY